MTITISWAATSLGANFDRYLVSRRRTASGPWDLIAEVHTEATTSFDDREHRWSVAEHYRVQVVNRHGEVSLPSDTSVTKAKTDGGWTVTSNHSDLGIDADVVAGISLAMPSDRQLHVPHGRDYMLSTDTGRRRGLTLSFNVLVHDQPGAGKYNSWLDRLASDVPYWSLADHHGDRRLVSLSLAGSTERIDTLGEMTVEAVEVTDTPTPAVV